MSATGSLYLRFPFADGKEVVIAGKVPLTHDEYLWLVRALLDLEPNFIGGSSSPAPSVVSGEPA